MQGWERAINTLSVRPESYYSYYYYYLPNEAKVHDFCRSRLMEN